MPAHIGLHRRLAPAVQLRTGDRPAPHPLLAVQRQAGNRAVLSILQRRPDAAAPRVQRGFWSKVKKGFQKVGKGIKQAAQWVGRGFQKVGRGIKKAFAKAKKAAGKVWNGVKWVAAQLWSKLEGVFQRAAQWVTKLPARLARLVAHVWEGVKHLKPWSLEWWESLGKASTWADFGKWLGKLVLYGAEVAGVPEIAETIADFIKFNTRPLTGEERSKAAKVFGSAIPYDLVRVDKHAVVGPAFTGRAYVAFNTINGWATMDDHTLIHELTHVWQYNTKGAIYMPNAIHAQAWGAGYEYGEGISDSDSAALQRQKRIATLQSTRSAGGRITTFNEEQQGQVLGDYYVLRFVEGLSESSDEVRAYEPYVNDVRG